MEQLNLFRPEMPKRDHLEYLAGLLRIRWIQNPHSGGAVFEPYVEPDLLLFYAEYKRPFQGSWKGQKGETE